MSQNISRNVQVTYATNVNATAQQLIQAQVDITQSVSILAVRDEAGVFSMVSESSQTLSLTPSKSRSKQGGQPRAPVCVYIHGRRAKSRKNRRKR